MSDEQKIARQPFTFGGVARFARAKLGRLLLLAFAFGIISGVVVSWLAARAIAPVVDEAIANLPETGAIESGSLHWPERSGRLLAANAFVSVDVGLDQLPIEGAPVDFALQLRTNELLIKSLLGTGTWAYPARLELELNRTALLPAWGAWRGPILAGLIPGTAIGLMVTWAALAMLYAFVPLFIAKSFGRDLGFLGAWKLAVAAQFPGSLLMAFALALYSTGQISLVFVVAMLLAHFVPTLAYLLISPFLVPKSEERDVEENPFETEKKRKRKNNPFAGR